MKIQVLKNGPVVDVVDNAFCPTGKGGGVDPTCSPGKGGGSEFSEHAIRQLTWYKHHGYSSINKGLRSGKPSKSSKAAIESIESMFKPSDKDLVVFRGIRPRTGATLKQLQGIQVGDSFSDAGYASTSSDLKIAKSFAKAAQHVIKYRIPKGVPVISVDEVLGTKGTKKDEHEYLLPKGMQFVVSKITKSGVGVIIEMEPKIK